MTAHAAAAPEAELPPLTEGPHRKRIGLISVVACLGGLLFGYDTGVSNGAEGPMAKELGLSLLQLGVVISSLIFAAAVGALIGGKISDAIGRRKTIIVLAVMFFVGVLFVVFSPGFEILVAGRIILGLAVGGASTVVPVYLAELAPYEIRGSITGRNELAIVVGQFAAFVVNAILGVTLGHVDGVWRIMFGVCALPAVALFFGMLRMPESPRWLVEKGRDDEALAVLKTVRSEDRAIAEFAQVEQVAEDGRRPSARHQGDPGQQVAAAHHLRRHRCLHDPAAHRHQLDHVLRHAGAGGVGLQGDEGRARQHRLRSGRRHRRNHRAAQHGPDRPPQDLLHRPVAHHDLPLPRRYRRNAAPGREPRAAVRDPRPGTLFVLSMQTFLNIAVWVWLAEIFPLHIRGLAIGIAVFFCWVTNGFLALYVPTLLNALGLGTFFLFAVIGVIMLGFLWHEVPETRGRSLEALEEDLLDGEIYKTLPRRVPFARSPR